MSSGADSNEHKVLKIEAIEDGTVIDHIRAEGTLKVVSLLALPDEEISIGVNLRSQRLGRKGVVKISGRELSDTELSRLALIAPEATVSIIRNYRVDHKSAIHLPPAFIGIAHCLNPNCITNHEAVTTHFSVVLRAPVVVRCRYCERRFPADELTVL